MSSLYAQLHKALALSGRNDIGVSFPQAQDSASGLGAILRLHGDEEVLHRFCSSEWLHGVKDYVRVQAMGRVPDACQHRVVRRVQAKSGVERLRRRQIKRHGLTEDEAKARIPDGIRETLAYPYVRLSSASTGQVFLLFIKHDPLGDLPQKGAFNSYGLSRVATIPWF